MLRPSYSDLLEVLNKDADTENVIGSRYTIVIAAAKRARQLVDHAEPMTTRTKKLTVLFLLLSMNYGKEKLKLYKIIPHKRGRYLARRHRRIKRHIKRKNCF